MLKARNIPVQKSAALTGQRAISFSFQIPPAIEIAVQQHVVLDRPAIQPTLTCASVLTHSRSRLKAKLPASIPLVLAGNATIRCRQSQLVAGLAHGHSGNLLTCHEK